MPKSKLMIPSKGITSSNSEPSIPHGNSTACSKSSLYFHLIRLHHQYHKLHHNTVTGGFNGPPWKTKLVVLASFNFLRTTQPLLWHSFVVGSFSRKLFVVLDLVILSLRTSCHIEKYLSVRSQVIVAPILSPKTYHNEICGKLWCAHSRTSVHATHAIRVQGGLLRNWK